MTIDSFQALPLAAPLQRALADLGYHSPSPIQAQAIPALLDGRDILASAQTGTGKTAAFALPILHGIDAVGRKPARGEIRTLVLTPTRELAVQVADSFRQYGKHMKFSVGLVHGGVSQKPQEKALFFGLDVLIATPGRLLDLMNQGRADLSRVSCFVLDEADRMLDMGFINDIRKISAALPREKQTLLFSATLPPEITNLAKGLLREPVEIRIAPKVTTAEKIEQRIRFVDKRNKAALLLDMMHHRKREHQGELNLVFSRTRHGARKLARQLSRNGIEADAIHGDKSQAQRQRTLDRFRSGKLPVLVATDVAARGIDVKNITLVVNYDMPEEPESYVHRIGRTARADASGLAISFCSHDELRLLRGVEKNIRQSVAVDAEHAHHEPGIADSHQGGGRPSGRPDREATPRARKSRGKSQRGKPAGRNPQRRSRPNRPEADGGEPAKKPFYEFKRPPAPKRRRNRRPAKV